MLACVLNDDIYSGQIAVEHLINRGHRAIGMLAGPPNSYPGQHRARAYCDTMQALGLGPKNGWLTNCPPMVEEGMRVAQELLAAHPELTALICFNDLVAVGALKACAQAGLSVPGDIAVIGHDDIPLAELVTPALTTCRLSQYEMGQQAVQLLLERIGGCQEGCKEIITKPQLIIRASAP